MVGYFGFALIIAFVCVFWGDCSSSSRSSTGGDYTNRLVLLMYAVCIRTFVRINVVDFGTGVWLIRAGCC